MGRRTRTFTVRLNPTFQPFPYYLGIIRFKGEEFKGIHEPIIGEAAFTKVQEIKKESAKTRALRRSMNWNWLFCLQSEALLGCEAFLDPAAKQMEGNSREDTKQFDEDTRNLKANLSKTTNELENLIRLHAASRGISDSEVLDRMVREREDDRASIKANISSFSLCDTFDRDHKRHLNQILLPPSSRPSRGGPQRESSN